MEKSFDFKKKRSIGSIIEATFVFYKNEFTRFVPVILMIMLPIIIAVSILSKNIMQEVLLGQIGSSYFIIQLLNFMIYVLTSAISIEYIIAYINEQPLKASNIFIQVMKKLPKYILLNFVLIILYVLCTFLLILPAIYVFVLSSSLIIIARYEDILFFTSLNRSFKLMKNYWWKTFALLLVIVISMLTVSFVFQIPNFIKMADLANNPDSIYSASYNVFYIILGQIGSVLIMPIFTFSTTINYFNLVERKEKKSIIADIETIGE